MAYDPDDDKLIWERALEYLQERERPARAYEIANAIGSESPDYTRRECNRISEEGLIEKHYGDRIIGYPMPTGDLEVLPNNRQGLLQVVEKYEQYLPFNRSEVEGLSAPNLRTLLESELAVGDARTLSHRKVSFSYSGDAAEA